jgi:RNA polymerase primary sigma factor
MATSKSKKLKLSGNRKPQLERNDILISYYRDIRRYKPLSQEETKELFKLYRNGTKNEREFAFNKICNHNIRLVVSLARDYCSQEDNLNDLIQEGNIGLMKAVEMFDEENGTPFPGYSMYWIRRYINIFKTNITPMIAQTNRSKTANVIVTISNELYQKFERVPTPDEILDEYNIRYSTKPINETDDMVDVGYVYIDQFDQSEENCQGMQDFLEYNSASMSHNSHIEEEETEYNKDMVSKFLDGLTENETKVIRMLYGLDTGIETSVSVVSSKLGVSNQRISQLHSAALRKMKKKCKDFSYAFKL